MRSRRDDRARGPWGTGLRLDLAVASTFAFALALAATGCLLVAPETLLAQDASTPVVDSNRTPPRGTVPEGEQGKGPGTVDLKLRSAKTGKVVSGRVRLWRLGVAASNSWTSGDQIQWSGVVPVDGIRVVGLPEGRYRVEVVSQGRSHADPQEFPVGAAAVEVDAPAHELEGGAFHLRVFRTDGSEVRSEAEAFSRCRTLPWSDRWSPPWARPREPLQPEHALELHGNAGSGTARALERDARGFRLGQLQEQPRDRDDGAAIMVACPAVESWVVHHVYVPRSDVSGQQTTFVATVPLNPKQLLRGVRLADGRLPRLSDDDGDGPSIAWFHVWSRAIPVTDGEFDDGWKRAPVCVEIALRGGELRPLRFDWTVESADREHVLPLPGE